MNSETQKLINVMFKVIHKSWRNIFAKNEQILSIITKVTNFINNRHNPSSDYAPSADRIFRVFSMPIDDIKVVIVGQDPYPNPEDPDGLAFSTQSKICPKSLSSIFTALRQSKLIDDKPSNFDLTQWHNQGVFLLNITLTVEPYKSDSHSYIWHGFTQNIVSIIAQHHINRSIKFMLWGSKAQMLDTFIIGANIGKQIKHDILKWSHPTAAVGGNLAFKFCDHFSIATRDCHINWNLTNTNNDEKVSLQDKQNIPQKPLQLLDEKFSLDSYFSSKTVWFTDGSCISNGPKATSFEWGVFKCYENGVKCNKSFGGTDTKKTSEYNPSNIKGEGKAILFVLENLNPTEKNILYTDSQFWVNMITDFMPNWYKKGINFNEKKNPELTTPIFNAYKKIKDSIIIEFISAYHNYKPKTELESFIYAGNKRAEDIAKSYKK